MMAYDNEKFQNLSYNLLYDFYLVLFFKRSDEANWLRRVK